MVHGWFCLWFVGLLVCLLICCGDLLFGCGGLLGGCFVFGFWRLEFVVLCSLLFDDLSLFDLYDIT